MDWSKIDKDVSKLDGNAFFKKHQKLFVIIEGLIIIGLMFGIVLFMIQDQSIKSQIKDTCGYTTSRYECICDANYVANWKDLKNNNLLDINITSSQNG